jgi:purine-binding chemotaxis protein CheW
MTGLHSSPPAGRLVAFRLDEQLFGLPLETVERVLPMVAVTPLPQAPAIARGVIDVHGRITPVVDLRRRLGFPDRTLGLTAHLLVGRTRRRTLALPVDAVLGVREVETAVPAGAVLPGLAHLAGIVAMPDGLLFIHDLDAFLSLDEERQLATALEAHEA